MGTNAASSGRLDGVSKTVVSVLKGTVLSHFPRKNSINRCAAMPSVERGSLGVEVR
jgi:ribosomal protein S3